MSADPKPKPKEEPPPAKDPPPHEDKPGAPPPVIRDPAREPLSPDANPIDPRVFR